MAARRHMPSGRTALPRGTVEPSRRRLVLFAQTISIKMRMDLLNPVAKHVLVVDIVMLILVKPAVFAQTIIIMMEQLYLLIPVAKHVLVVHIVMLILVKPAVNLFVRIWDITKRRPVRRQFVLLAQADSIRIKSIKPVANHVLQIHLPMKRPIGI